MPPSWSITNQHLNKGLFLLHLTIINRMASTMLCCKAPFFLSLLTMMLLSAAQGVNCYASGYSERVEGWCLKSEEDPFSLRCAVRINVGNSLSVQELDNGDESVTSADILQQWKDLYSKIREEEKAVQNLFRDATNAQFKAGTHLRSAELKKDGIDPVQLTTLQAAFDKSVADLKIANLQQKEIKKLVEKSRKLNSKPGSLTDKKVNGMRTAYNDYLSRYYPGQPPVEIPVVTTPAASPPPAPPIVQPTAETQAKPTSQSKSTTQAKPKVEEQKPKQVANQAEPNVYDPDMVNKRPGQAKSFQYLAQPFQCIFELDTFDRASGLSRKALKPGILFTHTDPDLKPFFRGKDLITCLGRVSKAGSYVQLTIEFQIASSHSQSNFGSLEEGSLLRFKLMNDEYISLFNLKTNTGHIDPYTGYTIFSGQYALGKQEINKLSTLELDKMRVMWSTGFEDYDVYHVDFLINQLNCVMSK
jgi:hypothetical protein